LWSIGVYDLGLSDADFWWLSARDFVRLMNRYEIKIDRNNYNTALIISAIYNTVRDPKKKSKPFEPKDFLPKPKQDLLKQAEMLTKLYGGKDSRKAVD
jgi:hypothetical protein